MRGNPSDRRDVSVLAMAHGVSRKVHTRRTTLLSARESRRGFGLPGGFFALRSRMHGSAGVGHVHKTDIASGRTSSLSIQTLFSLRTRARPIHAALLSCDEEGACLHGSAGDAKPGQHKGHLLSTVPMPTLSVALPRCCQFPSCCDERKQNKSEHGGKNRHLLQSTVWSKERHGGRELKTAPGLDGRVRGPNR